MADVKFSQFTVGNNMRIGDQPVGLRPSSPADNFIFNFPGTGIEDANGNFLLQYATVGALAANSLKFLNSDTTLPVTITADGSDANIAISLEPKGSAHLILDGLNWPTADGVNTFVIATDGAGNLFFQDPATGSVVSVGLSLPASVFSITGSPVTGTGTLTGSFINQSANTVFAGPTTGAATTPDFRALVVADLPTVDVPHGGTGLVTTTAYGLITGGTTSTGNFQNAGTGNSGEVYVSGGAAALGTWTALSGISVTSITGTTHQIVASSPTGAVTLSLPASVQISTAVLDSNANPVIGITSAVSPVNSFSISNAPTGNPPSIGVSGSDSDISFQYNVKNNGVYQFTPVDTTSSNHQAEIRLFYNTSGVATTYVGMKAPSAPTSYTVVLPNAQGGANTFLKNDGSGNLSWAAGATGAVTSVALSLPSFITVSGSPVTTSGTLTGTLATQTANTVFAGPSSGGALAPTFRALVAADISAFAVTSLTGTSNKVTVSASTGAVTISLPASVSIPTSILDASGNTLIGFTSNAPSITSFFNFQNNIANRDPILTSSCSGTDCGMSFQAKGTGTFNFLSTSTASAKIRLYEESSTSQYVSLAAPTSGVTAYTVTLPGAVAAASGSILTSTTGGVTSWTAPTGVALGLSAPTRQIFTSGSGTYTTPTSPAPLYIEIIAIGAGGGGGNSGSTAGTAATTGGNSTFGAGGSQIIANGGANGVWNSNGGTGGLFNLNGNSGFGGDGQSGGPSFSFLSNAVNSWAPGGSGGSSQLGGGGTGTINSLAGNGGIYGGGGGGAGATGVLSTTISSGSGGGGGGLAHAYINSPAATYAYAVGTGGSGQTAGTSGFAGGAGASGIIIVIEHYQ